MSLWNRLSAWWSKDKLEHTEEETGLTEAERDREEEDFEARKDDVVGSRHGALEGVDYERDSEPPGHL